MRLIDADELRKAIESLPNCYNGFSDTYDKACIIGVIDEQPTADPGLDEWCTDCKEYDAERHCCPRFNRVIREALEEAMQNVGMDRCRWYDTCPDAEAADVQGWNQLTKKEDGNE